MSRRPSHRGPAPEDAELFAPRMLPRLREAVGDLCWLLDRGYALVSSAELVGNRYTLTARQRMAVNRSVCAEADQVRRHEHEVQPDALRGQELWLDGFNVLTVVEAALAGGVILRGRDGCLRDIASVHARHHEVEETQPALHLLGTWLSGWGVVRARWWLDRPVSNSGRLKRRMLEVAAANGWAWDVELVFNPDKVLAESTEIITTADSVILDRCRRWVNVAWHAIARGVPGARLVDLSEEPAGDQA